MISKQLVHDIVVFHNSYANNEHTVATVQHFLNKFISVRFAYWSLNLDGCIDKLLFSVNRNIETKEDYIDYVKEVNYELNLINDA